MKATEAIYARRSVRDFTPDVVPESTIRHLIDAAIQAPSAMNSQPWAFVVIQDPEILSEINSKAHELGVGDYESDGSIFYNSTSLVIVCANSRLPHADWDCCLAAENLLVSARDRGVGACTVGSAWKALNDPEIKGLIGIPEGYQAVVPIIIGFPKEFPPNPGRRPAEILSWKTPARVE